MSAMPTVGVWSPVMGQVSETFIQRHTELVPGNSHLFTWGVADDGAWHVEAWDQLPKAVSLGRVARRLHRRPSTAPAVASRHASESRSSVWMKDHGVTHVLLEYLDPWPPYLPALRESGVKVIAHGHGYDVSARLRQPWVAAYRAYADYADAVVVVSAWSRQRLIQLGLPGDASPRHSLWRRSSGRTRLRISTRGLTRWAYVGRLVAKKGPVQVIRLRRVRRIPNYNSR